MARQVCLVISIDQIYAVVLKYVCCFSPGYLTKFTIVQAPGEERFKITQNPDFPGWNDVGSFYAYTSEQEGTKQYYLQNVDGASAHEKWRLLQVTTPDQPSWVVRETFWTYPDHGGSMPQPGLHRHYSLVKDSYSKWKVSHLTGGGWEYPRENQEHLRKRRKT